MKFDEFIKELTIYVVLIGYFWDKYSDFMEDLGNWLYIIVIAIAAISSAFQKKRKKEEPPVVVFSDEEPVRPKRTFMARPGGELKPQTAYSSVASALSSGPLNTIAVTPPMAAIEDEGLDIDLRFDDCDEIRKGIIYSEILERKY